MIRLTRKLSYNNLEFIEARDLDGGLILMWNKNIIMNYLCKTNCMICCRVKNELIGKC